MKNNFNFFKNSDCKYFPCHSFDKINEKDFNCLFCFCPLYFFDDCGGNFTLIDSKIKDCSNCTIPHKGISGYEYILKKISLKYQI